MLFLSISKKLLKAVERACGDFAALEKPRRTPTFW
jgi:hypothetical protein